MTVLHGLAILLAVAAVIFVGVVLMAFASWMNAGSH